MPRFYLFITLLHDAMHRLRPVRISVGGASDISKLQCCPGVGRTTTGRLLVIRGDSCTGNSSFTRQVDFYTCRQHMCKVARCYRMIIMWKSDFQKVVLVVVIAGAIVCVHQSPKLCKRCWIDKYMEYRSEYACQNSGLVVKFRRYWWPAILLGQ